MKKNVLWLEISMNLLMIMQMKHSINYFLNKPGSFIIRKVFF